jgi:hypothetical protein
MRAAGYLFLEGTLTHGGADVRRLAGAKPANCAAMRIGTPAQIVRRLHRWRRDVRRWKSLS